MAATLALAGSSSSTIDDVFDEEIYFDIPELIDGTVNYISRDNCQTELIENLCLGFIIHSVRKIWNISFPLSVHMFLSVWEVSDMIRVSNLAFKQRSTPGS